VGVIFGYIAGAIASLATYHEGCHCDNDKQNNRLTNKERSPMPRLKGQAHTGAATLLTALAMLVLGLILLEYYGIINVLPGIGLL
jgi:hypothetical protein